MAKQIISRPTYDIDLSKCTVYYRSQFTARMWDSLRISLSSTINCFDLTSKKKAYAIVFVSSSIILVI